MSRMASSGMEPSSECASIHSMVSSASVTLAGCSGASPNRTATARCNRRSASWYAANSGNSFNGRGRSTR